MQIYCIMNHKEKNIKLVYNDNTFSFSVISESDNFKSKSFVKTLKEFKKRINEDVSNEELLLKYGNDNLI